MLLAGIVETSRRIGDTPKRLRKIELLAELLRQLDPEEVEAAVAYLSGRARQGKIGLGYAAVKGGMGAAAENATLRVMEVDRAFTIIAETQGRGSARERSEAFGALMARATAEEQNFLSRLIVGELRQGALEGIMVEGVAKAAGVSADGVRRAAMLAGDVAAVARSLMEHGEAGLSQYGVSLFRPVQPMLAQSAEDIGEALADLGEAALEYKMDGARVQVHRSGEDVVVYSRGLNDVTAAAPEIVELVRAMPAKDLILDGEVLCLQSNGRPQPFQTTMRRFGRKLNIEAMRAELPMTSFWFDLLYLDGGDLLDEPQARRFAALAALTPEEFLIPHLVTGDPASGEEFLRGALERGHEGVMAKATGAGYAAGARGQSWLKVKQARTLDLVILAAEWGSGRRQGWLSNLHLGARDVEKGGFAMLGKTFKGLTDETLAWQTQEFLKIEIGRDAYTVHLEPKIVAEIAFNEIQASSRYVSGLALRFARVKRYRPDKSAAEADTFQTVKQLASL